jgi:hypothetical protein
MQCWAVSAALKKSDDAGDRRGDGGAVGGEGLVPRAAGVGNLSATPRGGARSPGLHDKGDTLPQTVDVGTAELVAIVEAALHPVPVILELEEESVLAGCLNEGAAGGALARAQRPAMARVRLRFTGSKCEQSERPRKSWCPNGTLIAGS